MRKLGLLLMVMFATSSFAQGTSPFKTSFYTEIKPQHCLTTYSTEWEEVYEIDGSVQECPGFSGYQVFVKSGDARSWLELRYNGITTSFSDEIIGSGAIGAFPAIAPTKFEWRVEVQDQQASVYGAIFRVEATTAEGTSTFSRLYVLRLNAGFACLIGVTTTNTMARTIVDDMTRTCL